MTKTNTTPASKAPGKGGNATQAGATGGGPTYMPAPASGSKGVPANKCLPPVRPNSHRAYAQAVMLHLAKAGPFTLGQFRAALVANPLPAGHPQRSVAPPTHGWSKHNMPTWCAQQGWLLPATPKAKAPAAPKAKAPAAPAPVAQAPAPAPVAQG
jgi:hypothetical protein